MSDKKPMGFHSVALHSWTMTVSYLLNPTPVISLDDASYFGAGPFHTESLVSPHSALLMTSAPLQYSVTNCIIPRRATQSTRNNKPFKLQVADYIAYLSLVY